MSQIVEDEFGRALSKTFANARELFIWPLRVDRLRSHQLRCTERAFSRHGRVLTGAEMAHEMRRHLDQSISKLAKSIDARNILSYCWKGQSLVPTRSS